MKKRVGVLSSLVVVLFLLLLLTSCTSRAPAGDRPQDIAAALKAVQTGTQGVVLSVLPNYPPPLLYDQNEFLSLVEVRNRGNFDLDAQSCFVQMIGFDPNIITGTANVPHSCAENIGTLEGKNVYNTEGGSNEVEFFSSNVNLPDGVFEYKPTLTFLACYNYRTRAAAAVCVDPQLYQISSEQRTCTPKDVSLAGGQGAPVGVSYVGVDMVTGRGQSRAIFEINIVNQGGGKVLSPTADIRSCATTGLQFNDLDRVQYNVQLSGGSLVSCKPLDGLVRLHNNQGKVVCTFDVTGSTAFETPLLVELDYGYIDSIQKQINIIKTPQ
ncbi:TPA: hypothetical protein HA241_02330 [Candidatus Woesearchaeota archaeon]|nr:hypothetical protein [Candidatus Woesearchaeota archaeon]